MSEWIKCSERMPLVGEDIIYCTVDDLVDIGSVQSADFTCNLGKQLFVRSEGYELRLGDYIHYWQPIPKPPQY